jgi:toxin ParE1/3/4
MPEVSFHPGATADYFSAYDWYSERSAEAAAAFERAFDTALREISDAPTRWHIIDERHRMHLLERFPYQIVYRVLDESIVVIAVAHARRRAKYWVERN